MRAALLIAVLALVACDGRAASNAAQERLTNPQRLVQAAGARGEVPSGDYVCRLAGPRFEVADPPQYGLLAVRGSAYQLRLDTGRTLAGQIHATPTGRLIWDGPLGPIDTPPRGITRATVAGSGEDAVVVIFQFGPELAPLVTEVICTMPVGSSV